MTVLRQELRDALAKEDPIRWVAERVAAGRRRGSGSEVLESLKRVLEWGTTTKPGKRCAQVKR